MSVERVMYDRLRVVPEPEGCGTLGERARWKHMRDGLGELIRMCPKFERQLGNRLGELWCYLDSRLDDEKESGGQWPSLY
jgi:hypothetical protein